jgi:hypothetical protein
VDASSESRDSERSPRRARHVFGAVLILIAGLFLTVSWGLPHLWVLLAGLLLAALAFMAMGEIKRRVKLLVLAAGGVLLALLAVANIILEVKDGSGSEETQQSIQAIQLALERYAVDSGGFYPLTMDPVQDEGYLPTLPTNRYARRQIKELSGQLTGEQLDALTHMQPLGANRLPEELREQLEWPGNFVYLPRIEADDAGGHTARGYSLLAFGLKHWDPGWWDAAQNYPIVVYYYNSETGVEQRWE